MVAGCGGPALLREAQPPLQSSKPVAEEKDERILARIETVILRNGPGAWASDAEWDEYLIRIRAVSDEPVEIREVAIFDALDHRIEARSDRGDLVDGTRDIVRRYEQSGKLAGASHRWGAAEGSFAGSAVVASALAPSLAVAVVALPVALGVVAGSGVMRLVNNSQVGDEIKRRGTTLPVVLPGGAEARIDLFFPMTPLSGRAQVVYADRHGEHRLDVDTHQALMDLDPPPVLVARVDPEFPVEARRIDLKEGRVVARLTLDREGRVKGVEVITPRSVFDSEAWWTLRKWTYSEGRGGRVVEATVEFRR